MSLNDNLIQTGTLTGTIAIGGMTDYNDLENKPQINGVTLSGNKTTSDLDLFSGDYDDLTNKPTIPVLPSRYSFLLLFGLINSAQYITSDEFVQIGSSYTYNITDSGAYLYMLMINAEWSQGAYQFYAGLDVGGTTTQANNSFAIAQGNATNFFIGTVNIANTGNTVFKAMCRVSNADKNVKIEPFTSINCILIKL